MMEQKYPRFINDDPKGKDDFKSQSHKRIADAISDLIQNNKLDRKVIGLEGEWGSGKSNLIKIVNNSLNQDEYHTYIFDAWGNQEDLTRRTFLEELIESLICKKWLDDTAKWNNELIRLLAKKSTTVKQTFPSIKLSWIAFTLSFSLFLVLSTVYSLFPDNYLFTNYLSPIKQLLLFVGLFPLIFFAIGFKELIKEYKDRRGEVKTDENVKETKIQTFSRILYWLNGTNLESEEKENVIEEEPTVKQFKRYFEEVLNDIGDKKLIIVFDNFDRLEKEKTRSLWSSIHTFFSDISKTNFNNAWVIVPYDKEKIKDLYEKSDDDIKSINGFINKTFATIFRISPPVVTDWEDYFDLCFHKVFGKKIITKDQLSFCRLLFDRLINTSAIKPRDIISYLNQLASLYSIWEEDLNNGSLKFKYIALFPLVKDSLIKSDSDTESIVDSLLNRGYLKETNKLFRNDSNLETAISAILFNVPLDKADEVVLKRNITNAIYSGSSKELKTLTEHMAFEKFFRDSYESMNVEEIEDNVIVVLKTVSEKIHSSLIQSYWDDFASKVQCKGEFNEKHKTALLRVNDFRKKRLIVKVYKQIEATIGRGNDTEIEYFETIKELYDFIEVESIDKKWLLNNLKKIELTAESYLALIREYGKNEVEILKCYIDEESLDEFFKEGDDLFDNDRLYDWLDIIPEIKNLLDLNAIESNVKEELEELNSAEEDDFYKQIEILKVISKRPIHLKMNNMFYMNSLDKSNDLYYDWLSICISNFNQARREPSFINALEEVDDSEVDSLAEVIQYYISYGDIIINYIKDSELKRYYIIKKVINKITTNNYGVSRINLQSILSNLSSIKELLFDENNDFKEFLRNLNGWSRSYKIVNYQEIDEMLARYFNWEELKLIRYYLNDSRNYIKELDEEEITEIIFSSNKFNTILVSLLEYNLLDKFSNKFYKAFQSSLQRIISKKNRLVDCQPVFGLLLNKLDGRRVPAIFARTHQEFIDNVKELENEEIIYLIDHYTSDNRIKEYKDEITLEIIPHLLQDDELINEVFSRHLNFFLDCIDKSKKYKEDTKEQIIDRLDEIEKTESRQKIIDHFELNIED